MKKTLPTTAELISQLEQANTTNRKLLLHLLSSQQDAPRQPRPQTRLCFRLLGTLALLGLLAAIVLVTGHRAQSAGGAVAVQVTGTPNVSVTNTPTVEVGNATLAVSNVNEPAMQPFQTRGAVSLLNSAFTASTTIAVPSGKRLVVETVSMLRSPDANSKTESVQVEVDASFNGLITAYDLPFVSSNGTAFPGIAQPMRFYADGGTNLTAVCYRTGSSGAETDVVYISGYLVNIP